ncbi:HAD family hydrolase [Conyzicola nivalis]|uniref:Phosphoglycolate phosphatase n=1 Tax=Conyzicola nivalis TaxID=1477021 RepID=A0A916SMW9_9MICO|nr:HAD hydrolase-like protein [Conyzicola nivalis]GGB08398.1 phosphoglycolate phosphatase [Conyzicola nivalis]
MTTPYSCILFDLDGTIVDSAPGITATLAYMFEQLGKPIPTPSELLRYVGPPLLDSFRDLAGFSPEESARALGIYREKYLNVGAYDATQYPGVGLVLKAVHESPLPMSLATSKPETPATLILEHFNLARYFDIITGASDDEVRSAKKDVVAEALIRLEAMGADISRPVLVGDREHDVHGAAANDVPTIFVEWGYGSVAEQAGSVAVVKTPEELKTLLLG